MNISTATQGSVEPAKTKWLVGFVLFVIVLTTAPYLFALAKTPDGLVLSGSHTLAPGDIPVYLSYIEQAKQGEVFFRDVFTSESHSAFQFNPLWLGVGLMAKAFSLGSLTAFHLARILLIPVFLIVLERWLRPYLPRWPSRRLALLLIVFGAGIGALIAPWGLTVHQGAETFWPMDLWVTEAYSFLTLYQSPHFIAASTLLLLVLHWFTEGVLTRRSRFFVQSGLALLLLTSFHPFHLPTVTFVFGAMILVYGLSQWRIPWLAIRGALIVAGIASPMILYHGLLLLGNSVVVGRALQNINHTPAWWIVLCSYGAFIPLALIGLWRQWPFSNPRWRLLAVWLFVQYLVFTIPSPLNRRMTEGWIFPLGVFAVIGFLWIWDRWLRPKRLLAATIVVGVLSFGISPLVVIGQDLAYWQNPTYAHYPYYFYYSKDYTVIADWLRMNTRSTDVVFSGIISSLAVASQSARPIVLAHTVETLDFYEKFDRFNRVFRDGNAIGEGEALMREWNVHYILWGGEDTKVYPLHPGQFSGFQPVFMAGSMTLYQFQGAR